MKCSGTVLHFGFSTYADWNEKPVSIEPEERFENLPQWFHLEWRNCRKPIRHRTQRLNDWRISKENSCLKQCLIKLAKLGRYRRNFFIWGSEYGKRSSIITSLRHQSVQLKIVHTRTSGKEKHQLECVGYVEALKRTKSRVWNWKSGIMMDGAKEELPKITTPACYLHLQHWRRLVWSHIPGWRCVSFLLFFSQTRATLGILMHRFELQQAGDVR